MSPLWRINIVIAIVFGAFVHCSTRECRAGEVEVSISDSALDRTKAIVTMCENDTCYELVVNKVALDTEYDKIEQWFNAVEGEQ
jgi:hypothetical protein